MRVWESGFRVRRLGCHLTLRVQSLIQGLGFRVLGLGFEAFGFRIQGLEFRVYLGPLRLRTADSIIPDLPEL